MLRLVMAAGLVVGLATAGFGVVKIPPARRAEAELLGREVLADQGDLLFLELDQAGAAALSSNGWSARVLSADYAPGSYFMVPHTSLNPAGAPGRVLWDDERRAVVQLSEAEASEAQADGWLLVPLPRKPRALVPDIDGSFNWEPDTAVERMVGMVSLDTLMQDIRHLQDYGTRYSYSPKCETSGLWIADQFTGLGWDVVLDTYYIQGTRAINVEATLPGTVRPDSIVVACGHYDSYTRQGMTSAPGADDNATGTAILIELARVLRDYRFRWTIKLLSFSGEEQWMKGSYHWVDSVAVPQGMDIYGAYNVDMIGFTAYDSNYMVVNRDVASAPMAALAESTNNWYDIGLAPLNYLDPDCAGDNTPFWEAGFRSTFALEDSEWGIWNGSNPHYHTTHDTVGFLRSSQVTRIAKMTVACVAHNACPDGPTAIAEPWPPALRSLAIPTTFAHGQLVFKGQEASRLVDVHGRVVRVLAAGTNDLRGVAAGVYYVQPPDRALPVRRLILVE